MDSEDIADLATDEGRVERDVARDDIASGWGEALIAGREPASWVVVRRLFAEGYAGILVSSFATGATHEHQTFVPWRWGPNLPHKVTVHDPAGKLSENQLAWT